MCVVHDQIILLTLIPSLIIIYKTIRFLAVEYKALQLNIPYTAPIKPQTKPQIKIDRYWTCNKELTNLKYITINEDKLNYEEKHLIHINQNKIIYNEKKQPTCKIHSRIISEKIEEIERTAVTQTIEELTQKTAITEDHKKRIEKKQLQYEKTVNHDFILNM